MPPFNANSNKSNDAEPISLEGKEVESKKCFLLQNPLNSSTMVRGKALGDADRVCSLIGELLCDIYGKMETNRRISGRTCDQSKSLPTFFRWAFKDVNYLKSEKEKLEKMIEDEGVRLVRQLKKKNFLLSKREAYYDVVTAYVQAVSPKTREDTKMKFSLSPGAETGFSQWVDAMKMVAQLPGGMPPEFRTKLWLQLSEKHLNDRKVNWEKEEIIIFNEWTNPDDEELGVQIVKDLHRTGCSLFCGEQEHNQALLKRVLLAYARWNKSVGYCQGFNMLAALILQVMEKDEKNAVKVMIYLIEGVLPESYFANNLRGLSVDMAVFRDLLRLRLPKLSKHLEALQHDTNSGSSYEPPLTNVFTMQWFLTLFSNCLPQHTVLRVWDLVFLYGNEVLLRTALAIWGILQDRVISVESADEFYSIMGVVTREMLEFGLMDANTLIKMIAMVDPFPTELQELREKYLYNISPWTQSVQSAARKGIKLFYSDADDHDDTEDEDKIALATAYGVFRRKESGSRDLQVSGPTLDIGVLKQQYAKLRQRQRQAHVIITAACNTNLMGNITSGPGISVNHLLMGKSALINKGKRIGPPEGSVPPCNTKRGYVDDLHGPQPQATEKTCQHDDGENGEKPLTDQCREIRKLERKKRVNIKKTKDRIKNEWKNKKKNRDGTEENNSEEKDVSTSLSSSSISSSTSTELCDSDSDSDIEDNNIAWDGLEWSRPQSVRTTSLDRGAFETDVCTMTEGNARNITSKSSRKKGTEQLVEVKDIATTLVKEIEEEIQSSTRLQRSTKAIKLQSGSASLKSKSYREVKRLPFGLNKSQTDNTNELIFLSADNILKMEPEVPPLLSNVAISSAGTKNLGRTTLAEAETCQANAKNKSEFALNIIRENSKILHKFARKSSGTSTGEVRKKKKEVESDVEINRALECTGNYGSEFPWKLQKTFLEKGEKIDSVESIAFYVNGSNLISPKRIENGADAEGVHIKVNTEMIFGVGEEKIPIRTAGLGGNVESEAYAQLKEQQSFMIEGLGSKQKEILLQDDDDDGIKAKIEISKSDWEVKMRKIAELENTTRETLKEIRAQSTHRKSFHRSLDRNTRRTHIDIEDLQEKLRCQAVNSETVTSDFEEPERKTTECSRRSFDAIASRTEKLLKNTDFHLAVDHEARQREIPKHDARNPNDFNRNKIPSKKEKDFRTSQHSPNFVGFKTSRARLERMESSNKGKTQEGEMTDRTDRRTSGDHRNVPVNTDSFPGRSTFNPFPTRIHSRPKELGLKLGLYPTSPESHSKKS